MTSKTRDFDMTMIRFAKTSFKILDIFPITDSSIDYENITLMFHRKMIVLNNSGVAKALWISD